MWDSIAGPATELSVSYAALFGAHRQPGQCTHLFQHELHVDGGARGQQAVENHNRRSDIEVAELLLRLLIDVRGKDAFCESGLRMRSSMERALHIPFVQCWCSNALAQDHQMADSLLRLQLTYHLATTLERPSYQTPDRWGDNMTHKPAPRQGSTERMCTRTRTAAQ